MVQDVQILSASQIIQLEAADLLCSDIRFGIERAEGRNRYRVWYPVGYAAPNVWISQGALQFIESGQEDRETFPQFSGEEQLPENTIIHYTLTVDGETYYYGVNREVETQAYSEYEFTGSLDPDAIPAFMLAAGVYTHPNTDRPCLAIATSQVSATDGACAGQLSIEKGQGKNVYRIWYPLGGPTPSYEARIGGFTVVEEGTEVRTTYPTFSGLESLPEDGEVLISTSITVGEKTLYYGVQRLNEEYGYIDLSYFGTSSEDDPDFMIAYGVYTDPESGVPCPIFTSTQVQMSDDTCSAEMSIEGRGENVYRIWYPFGGMQPNIRMSTGEATVIGNGSEDRITYPQFSGVDQLPLDVIVYFSKIVGETTLHYGVAEESKTYSYLDVRVGGFVASDVGPPAFLAAFGIYDDPETGEPCVGFSASRISTSRDAQCPEQRIRVSRGEGPSIYRVSWGDTRKPTVRTYKGTIELEDTGRDSVTTFPSYSGEETVPSGSLINIVLGGKNYGIKELTENWSYEDYKFTGPTEGADVPGFIIAYSVVTGANGEDCIAFASTQAFMDIDQECKDRITIGKSEEPNHWTVSWEQTGATPSISISKGGLIPHGTVQVRSRTSIRTYQGEDSKPTGKDIISRKIEGKWYGVVEETVTEKAQDYIYVPPASEALLLCLEDDDPNKPDVPPPDAHVIAWSVFTPVQGDSCVGFASASISYECPRDPRCESPLSLSISAGESVNTVVVTYSGLKDTLIKPRFITSNGALGNQLSSIETVVTSIEQYSNEVEIPSDSVADVLHQGRHFGFREINTINRADIHEVKKSSSDSYAEDVVVYGFLAEGFCHALASGSIPVVLPRVVRDEKWPVAQNTCWVELEHKDSELLYVSHGQDASVTVEAMNATLVYRGQDTINTSRIVEFSEQEEEPDGSIFSYTRPNFERFSRNSRYDTDAPEEYYYGFKSVDDSVIRDIYRIDPDDYKGRENIYVYAYTGDSPDCNAYAQIIVPAPYDEPNNEEYEVYRVASRIIITEEGVFSCPGPDYQTQIVEALEDAETDTYLITELLHEQGYISQLWNRTWARPETHIHPIRDIHPVLSSIMPSGIGADKRDIYISWSSKNDILTGNVEIVPAGRPITAVYDGLEDVNSIPEGVRRRWPAVRLVDRASV